MSIKLSICSIIVVILVGCGGGKFEANKHTYIDILFNEKVTPIISSINIHDASSLYHAQIRLMIPVEHYSYSNLKNQNIILNKFITIIESLPLLSELRAKENLGSVKLDDFYLDKNRSGVLDRRVFPIRKDDGTIYHSPLSLLQFNYLLSQLAKNIVIKSKSEKLRLNEEYYLKLSVDYLNNDLIKPLYKDVESWWYSYIGDYPNMKARIEDKIKYKYNNKLLAKSYFSAFVDEELFFMAIASDLKYISNYHDNINSIDTNLLDNILDKIKIIFDQRLEKEGFLFDVGKWADHPSFQYANYKELKYPEKKYPKGNVSWDTSHSYRFPLWLRSYRDAHYNSSYNYIYYDNLIKKFNKQMEKAIIYTDKGPYLTNYIDGSNGWFRIKKERKTGYGPYTLSTIAQYGSWYLMGGENIDRFRLEMKNMILSSDKSIIKFRTNFYGEYDYTKKINPHGLRSIDLMGKGSLAELYILMIEHIKNNDE